MQCYSSVYNGIKKVHRHIFCLWFGRWCYHIIAFKRDVLNRYSMYHLMINYNLLDITI